MRFLGLLVALWRGVVLAAAGGPPTALKRVPPSPEDQAAFRRYVQEGRDSPFGLDCVFVLDRRFREPALARRRQAPRHPHRVPHLP